MTFDKPEHQELARQLIERATFSGQLLELAVEFKRAVAAAKVVQRDTPREKVA